MSDFDKSEYWFDGAEYDLQTARAMLPYIHKLKRLANLSGISDEMEMYSVRLT